MAKKPATSGMTQLPRIALVLLVLFVVIWPSKSVSAPKWVWPVASPVVTEAFDPPPKPWLAGHRGIDLAGRSGDLVRAAGSGFVTFAGLLADRGVVVISHGSIRTTYEPVKASVSVGDYVQVAETIGSLQTGVSHCSRNLQVICLHWGLRQGENYLNPIWLLNPRVRLKPIPRM